MKFFKSFSILLLITISIFSISHNIESKSYLAGDVTGPQSIDIVNAK